MARLAGCKVYNFSRGGMNARWYLDSFGDERGLWNHDLASQAYIMALGVNDISDAVRNNTDLGSIEDIDPADWRNNKRSFIGDYARILQRYREIAPDSYFFLMTIPRNGQNNERTPLEEQHRELLYALAFRHQYFLGGHMNPMGYLLTARMVVSYIDYIIRSDMRRFAQVGFINTPWKNTAQ